MPTTTLFPKEGKALPAAFYEPINTKGMIHEAIELSAININEDEEEYRLYVAVPGMRREDFSVCIDKNVITISGGRTEEYPGYTDRRKKGFSEWIRTFTLPENADPLLTSATFINGELEIHIPKGKNTEEKPLLIHVY